MSTTIEKLQKIINTKKALQTSINSKGGTITDDTPFDEYPLAVDGLSVGGGGTESEDSVAYYKRTRPKNWPYFPLPSEMTEEDDVIYLLYDATDFRCCPAFSATFTSCTCTLYKYMNTEVISEETLSLTSGTTMYLQYDDSQEDYNTFNYILIKLQGNITTLGTYKSKFNGVADTSSYVSELIEVSGKCNACDISKYKFHPCIKYYSFLGVSSTSMNGMFSSCSSLQSIPELDTSNVTVMSSMFASCYSLKSIPELNTSKVTNMNIMFSSCYSLQSIPELDTSNVTYMQSMFYSCHFLQSIPVLDTSKITNMNSMFQNCYSLQSIPELDTSKVTNMQQMFSSCSSLQSIPELDTSNVKNMNYMFDNCESLQSIPELDTSNVTNMRNMFSSCSSLQRINLLNPAVSFSISASTMFQREDLLTILNNLATVETSQTLTMGSTNLAKLTDTDKLIATEKGWTLA